MFDIESLFNEHNFFRSNNYLLSNRVYILVNQGDNPTYLGKKDFTEKEVFAKIALDKGYKNPMDYFKTLTRST